MTPPEPQGAIWSLGGDGMCRERGFELGVGASTAPVATAERGCHLWVPPAALAGVGS